MRRIRYLAGATAPSRRYYAGAWRLEATIDDIRARNRERAAARLELARLYPAEYDALLVDVGRNRARLALAARHHDEYVALYSRRG